MLIQVSTDNHVRGSEELTGRVESLVTKKLARFDGHITRVEVHLADDSSTARSSDDDKRCVIEARLAGLQPVTVSHKAASLDLALEGAATKIRTALERTLGKLEDR